MTISGVISPPQPSRDPADNLNSRPLSSVICISASSSGNVVEEVERKDVGPVQYRLYKRRWFMLAIVCILNISNAMLWICYAPIANYTDNFYCTSPNCHSADMLSMVFMIIAIPVGFTAMWSVDKYGLRTGILLGSWVNVIGAAIRVISTIPQIHDVGARYPIVLTGQCIAACAQPFIMYLPTKLAALWFPDGQRTMANTLGSMSNPLGILMAMSIAPAIVHSSSDHELLILNLALFAPCALVTVMATFGVCSSLPPTPPTSSAASISPPFFRGLKMALRTPSFLVLALCLGNGVGIFNGVYTLIQQILCPKGYSNSFVGLCGSLLILGGLLGSMIAGVIVDRTKWFEQVAKISYSLAAIVSCAFSMLALRSRMDIPIAFVVSIFGAAGFSIFPLGLEMGVECTYPVAEATSSGLLIISGQIFGIIYVVIMSAVAGPASAYDISIEKCTGTYATVVVPQDWTVPVLILCGAASIGAMLFVAAFWPQFKRMETEKRLLEQTKRLLQTLPLQQPVDEAAGGEPGLFRARLRLQNLSLQLNATERNEKARHELMNSDVEAEAERALLKYATYRDNDEASRKGMREEADRVIELIRDLRRDTEHWSMQIEMEKNRGEDARAMLELVTELVRSVLQQFPDGCPNGGGNELSRLEEAVKALMNMITKAEDELSNRKRQVTDLEKEICQIHADTDGSQRLVNGAMARLCCLSDGFANKMPLDDLVKAVLKSLEEDKQAKFEIEKALRNNKKKMDEMLIRRRKLLDSHRYLFEHCRNTERKMEQLGLITMGLSEGSERANAQCEHGLSWLIAQVCVIINELLANKRRLATVVETLSRSERSSQLSAEKRTLIDRSIHKMTSELEDPKAKVKEYATQNADAEKEAKNMRKMYDIEIQNVIKLCDQEDQQQTINDFDKKAKRLREELDSLHKRMAELKVQAPELSARIGHSLYESAAAREILSREEKGLDKQHRDKEVVIRNLHSDLAATQTGAKELERETEEYVEKVKNMKKEVKRRLEWRDITKNRLSDIRAHLEYEKLELEALKEEAERLRDRIKANKRTLEIKSARCDEMQRTLKDFGKTLHQLEEQNQELRWRTAVVPEVPSPASDPTRRAGPVATSQLADNSRSSCDYHGVAAWTVFFRVFISDRTRTRWILSSS